MQRGLLFRWWGPGERIGRVAPRHRRHEDLNLRGFRAAPSCGLRSRVRKTHVRAFCRIFGIGSAIQNDLGHAPRVSSPFDGLRVTVNDELRVTVNDGLRVTVNDELRVTAGSAAFLKGDFCFPFSRGRVQMHPTENARIAVMAFLGVLVMTSLNCSANKQPEAGRVREPAVAGQFYPAGGKALRSQVEEFVADGTRLETPARMIISPHAGYVFSGPLAGKAFATVDRSVETVILLGPSHRALFEGVSIPDVEQYETPLGLAPLDSKIVAALRKHAIVQSVPAAHASEHCLEVQIPFVQTLLPEAKIVPIIMGRAAPAEVAAIIEPLVDERTLVVASSDFSHYHDSRTAKELDKQSVQTILEGNIDGPIDGCGEMPIRVLMHIARSRGLEPVLLDARNSHEVAPQYGGSGRVVGYAAIVYVEKNGKASAADENHGATEASDEASSGSEAIDGDVKAYLLRLARASLEAAVRGDTPPKPDDAPSYTTDNRGCFVTLTKSGVLRGCIGYIEPIKPLCQAVIDNARSAALNDPRFPPVRPGELGDITVEVSVLTEPQPLPFESPSDLLRKLEPGRDGVILQKGFHRSTFLPQVWDQLPDREQFLSRLAMKGGMAADGWKKAEVLTYRAIHFEEGEH
ncbi:MAG: AmmeMemoRadiSam system protein B [Chitinivibrionales bacterium]|nr:AmmeMemoRadiSam system protein B [Chitinivibrionales bacterium]